MIVWTTIFSNDSYRYIRDVWHLVSRQLNYLTDGPGQFHFLCRDSSIGRKCKHLNCLINCVAAAIVTRRACQRLQQKPIICENQTYRNCKINTSVTDLFYIQSWNRASVLNFSNASLTFEKSKNWHLILKPLQAGNPATK